MTDLEIDRAKLFLIQELKLAEDVIKTGFSFAQNHHGHDSQDFIYTLILSTGVERYLKVFLHLFEYDESDCFITKGELKKRFSHNLKKMKDEITNRGFSVQILEARPFLKNDQDFLENNELLDKIVHVLSEFALEERYTYMNGISNPDKDFSYIEDLWTPIVKMAVGEKKYYDLLDELRTDEIIRTAIAKIIATIEKFLRAVARIALFSNSNSELRSLGSSHFFYMMDDQIGNTKYDVA